MVKDKINILGVTYKLFYKDENADDRLENLDGYADLYDKIIVVCNIETRDGFKEDNKEKITKIKNKILRHEILHAFIYESGLDCNSNKAYNWAENEEMVDWFAIQSPKIFRIYKELDIL